MSIAAAQGHHLHKAQQAIADLGAVDLGRDDPDRRDAPIVDADRRQVVQAAQGLRRASAKMSAWKPNPHRSRVRRWPRWCSRSGGAEGLHADDVLPARRRPGRTAAVTRLMSFGDEIGASITGSPLMAILSREPSGMTTTAFL